MISVLIADDQVVVRQGFDLFLRDDPRIKVVGHASSGTQAVEQVRLLRPDVVLMDIRMPHGDGLTATREVLKEFPNTRVVVVTTFDLDEYVFGALDMGAAGFLLKDTDPKDLVAAVIAAAEGGSVLSPRLTRRLIVEFGKRKQAVGVLLPGHDLSLREMEVVQHLARGLGNGEVADVMELELSTVKSHISNICRKLDVRTRVQIVIWAYQNDVVREFSTE
ncbi:DNA-binding response regulator [Rhodococcus sp. SRB_17]|uniref:response regulator transcription factor n=1 Tax=Rhodococcus sp. OK302 TaxID=1882769 RepID=UPI000B93D31A|nr:response regulator transcription factor [Rhodococcus sp. OK302]NMM82915.1 DNA-binding response regulator [Rhodococcus sp. SRB_17]OYD68131.1 LuxR family two component transcriptional regulator [Rhodococcus sp. OK302]